MGMAASQARYLALTARKSNCEYEGQQINQARLNLSNQSANLFNQMLGLDVPVPPSTTDFTKKQYSFTDGTSTYTIDRWNQLAEPDSEGYNYVVTYHYQSDVYTGYQKQMSDPQVQFSVAGAYPPSDDYATQIATIQAALVNITSCQETYDEKVEAYKTLASKAAQLSTYADTTTSTNVTSCTLNDAGDIYTVLTQDKDENGYLEFKSSAGAAGADRFYKGGKYYVRSGSPGSYTYEIDETEDKSGYVAVTTEKNYTKYNTNEMTDAQKTYIENALQALKDAKAIEEDYNINALFLDTANMTIAFGSDLENCKNGTKTILPLYYYSSQAGKPEDVPTILSVQNDLNAAKGEMDAAKTLLDVAEATYEALNVPSYVGNCKLTPLSELTDSQVAEIKQILADMEEQDVETNFKKCFNTFDETYNNTTYTGGIYTFELNGVTYLTTYYDLADCINNGTGINHIDDQPNLAYYAADYISKNIEKTEKALLETDSSGRFTSVRFEGDTIKYTLNVETITDDAAYQDAMNKYYYENAKYDKAVQDINAKTSIIQRQDQELEIRLKQLDTEQNALSTEMEAVQKVIKDNVDKTFKTFGG